eukprot:g6265.t1
MERSSGFQSNQRATPHRRTPSDVCPNFFSFERFRSSSGNRNRLSSVYTFLPGNPDQLCKGWCPPRPVAKSWKKKKRGRPKQRFPGSFSSLTRPMEEYRILATCQWWKLRVETASTDRALQSVQTCN